MAYRESLGRAIVAGMALLLPLVGKANTEFPNKPVRVVVGFAPGGGTDIVARAFAVSFSKALGQPVIVENKPGAGGSTGAGYVAKAPPDGYTLLISSASSVTISPAMNPKLGYTQKDFMPVTQLSKAPLILAVNKSLGVKTVQDLIRKAKAEPGKLNYASSGLGSGPHLAGVLFNQLAGTEMVHVPFKSGAPAALSVMAGDTQLTFATTPTVMESIRTGQLIGVAATTREKSPLVPDLPGMAAAGLGDYEVIQWNGLFAPAGTPAAVTKRLYDAARVAMAQPEMKRVLETDGTEVFVSESPADFQAFLQKDNTVWVNLVKTSGATFD